MNSLIIEEYISILRVGYNYKNTLAYKRCLYHVCRVKLKDYGDYRHNGLKVDSLHGREGVIFTAVTCPLFLKKEMLK